MKVREVGLAANVEFTIGAVTASPTNVIELTVPDVPVIVITEFPRAAELLAATVIVVVVVIGFGLNETVTPAGIPVAVNVTLLVKVPTAVIGIASVPLPPWPTLMPAEAAIMVKEGGGGRATERLMVVVLFTVPDVPVTVIVYVPATVVLAAESVSVLGVVVVAVVGLNAAVTPVGIPVAASVTLPVNPETGVTVIELMPLLP